MSGDREDRWLNLCPRGVEGGSVLLICSKEGSVCRTARRARSMKRISSEYDKSISVGYFLYLCYLILVFVVLRAVLVEYFLDVQR